MKTHVTLSTNEGYVYVLIVLSGSEAMGETRERLQMDGGHAITRRPFNLRIKSGEKFILIYFFLSGCTDRKKGDGVSSETVREAKSQSQSGTQLGEPAGPRHMK